MTYKNLRKIQDRLELHLTGQPDLPPICADFCGPSFKYRIFRGGGRSQALAKAIGLKHNANPLVFDATAGLGRDGFIMAALGCRVIMCERSPVIHALLEDGLRRAAQDRQLEIICQRIALYCGPSQEVLAQICRQQRPEVIYLDPMFPHRRKSALVKKEMRALRIVVGDDQDSSTLLQTALQETGQRVVCKRPAQAPILTGRTPDFTINTKKHRFDVYLKIPV
ncbi:MAG: class I SAM-dependent methyltransferase [Deltaproteobacteria bacterium]|nr:class I SAM-dependent methyltransferase [Deltaproteobacteria bacterium]